MISLNDLQTVIDSGYYGLPDLDGNLNFYTDFKLVLFLKCKYKTSFS